MSPAHILELQGMLGNRAASQMLRPDGRSGLPAPLKSGIESLSGIAMDDVAVHYNSRKPEQIQAYAFAAGTDIHLSAGQERHLPHEAWHVVQQKQGKVKPTLQAKGKRFNLQSDLEREADHMGEQADIAGRAGAAQPRPLQITPPIAPVIQGKFIIKSNGTREEVSDDYRLKPGEQFLNEPEEKHHTDDEEEDDDGGDDDHDEKGFADDDDDGPVLADDEWDDDEPGFADDEWDDDDDDDGVGSSVGGDDVADDSDGQESKDRRVLVDAERSRVGKSPAKYVREVLEESSSDEDSGMDSDNFAEAFERIQSVRKPIARSEIQDKKELSDTFSQEVKHGKGASGETFSRLADMHRDREGVVSVRSNRILFAAHRKIIPLSQSGRAPGQKRAAKYTPPLPYAAYRKKFNTAVPQAFRDLLSRGGKGFPARVRRRLNRESQAQFDLWQDERRYKTLDLTNPEGKAAALEHKLNKGGSAGFPEGQVRSRNLSLVNDARKDDKGLHPLFHSIKAGNGSGSTNYSAFHSAAAAAVAAGIRVDKRHRAQDSEDSDDRVDFESDSDGDSKSDHSDRDSKSEHSGSDQDSDSDSDNRHIKKKRRRGSPPPRPH